ncbi:MAG: Ig-like domain-containing protein [Kineosporiaceae bacterium]
MDPGSGEAPAVTAVTDPEHGTAEIAEDGTVTYTSAAGVKGTDTFDYTATDALGRTASGTVTVHVPNAAPTLSTLAPRTLVAGTSVVVPVTVADANADPLVLTYGALTGQARGTLAVTVSGSGANRSVRVTAGQSAAGTASIPLTVSDGDEGGTAARTLAVTVLPAAPVGVSSGVVPDPAGQRAVSTPVFSNGKPVARSLATRIDSQVTWRPSPTAGVTTYEVSVNGATVCTVGAANRSVHTCILTNRAIERGDVVKVRAKAGSLVSAWDDVPVLAGTASTLRILAVVYFPVGEFSLDATAVKVLGTVAAQARTYGLTSLTLVGHTDSDGSVASNQTLSQQRARQVRDWMRGRYSWVAGASAGRGELEPAVPNTSKNGKAANRRVEIYVGG